MTAERFTVPCMSGAARLTKVKEAVERAAASAPTAEELLEALERELQRAIPHDGSIWFGVDPVTMLATAPSRVEGMDDALCDTFWHLEFHEQDMGQFSDLARGDGAAALQLSLDGRPGRSIRYRECLVPQGYDDELRAVFRSGDAPWGAMALYREPVHDPFDEDDLAVVKAISGTVANALRTHVRAAVPWLEPSAPGLVVIGQNGRIASANREALEWLRLLWPMTSGRDDAYCHPADVLDLRDRGIGVPTALFALVAKARAVGDG